MKLSPERSRALAQALRAVTRGAQAAEQAPDTEAAKRALARLWSDVHEAYAAIDRAEREIHAEYHARLEGKAA